MTTAGTFDAAMLARVPLFASLPPDALRRLVGAARPHAVARGTVLFLQDEPADRFYIVLDGWVKLYRVGPDGSERIVHLVSRGESFAEAALFASARFPVTAETASNAVLLIIQGAGFLAALRESPEIALNMLAGMSRRLRQHVQEIEQVTFSSTAQRVAGFLLRYCPSGQRSARVELPVDKRLIASRLGMTPESLSRAFGKLKAVGVAVTGDQLEIADIPALAAFVQDGTILRPLSPPARPRAGR